MQVEASLADWLRLTLIVGIGDRSVHKLLKAFGLPEQVFAVSRSAVSRVLSEAQTTKLLGAGDDAALHERIEKSLAWVAAPENHVVTLADADYPQGLLETPDPPPLLYLKGCRELLARAGIAIVGSRNATVGGLANAESFAQALSGAGYVVVSGMALGVDTAAHRGGLKGSQSAERGGTIAVIGTGCDIVYPARNRDLAHAIVAAPNGLIVSEFPLGTPALADNFPRRNRIISGLSRGVLVVEAALRSGSLITARLAGEQGREVFALPGSIHSPLAKGCHKLIKDGAKLVDSVEDILEELGRPMRTDGSSENASKTAPDKPLQVVDAASAAVLEALGFDPVTLDALCERAKLPAEVVAASLMTLELDGLVQTLPGNQYQRVS